MEGSRQDVHIQGSPVHCPYCKDGLEDLAKVVACAACGARHHNSCHSEHGRCASCGEPQVLVPRASPPGGLRRRLEPPRGSRIRVEQDGAGVRYAWNTRSRGLLFCSIAFLVLFPVALLGLLLLLAYFKNRDSWVRVDAEGIEFMSPTWFTGTKVVRSRWEDVGAVRTVQGNLTIDVGIQRHHVGRFLQFVLQPAEIDWLTEALQAWKNEH
jgi:hypothetical protein